ncbi:MAG: branched-chain amino acid ABC transporter permease [Clostridiales bacterium]|jgi:branched-chain amino acid transport system permease protein|nr:branched-chain amino acid ABC transporter permease [Clostridiales bacterium]
MEEIRKKHFRSFAINFLLLAALYAIFLASFKSGILNNYYQGLICYMLINIMLTVSLNLTTGFLGQLPLGHAGFMAVGAYASGIFTKTVLLPPAVSLALALAISSLMAFACGIAIGVPALRLKGDYLAIITLGFGEIIRNVILNLKITGGTSYRGIPQHAGFTSIFWITAACVYIISALISSRHGRAILSIREDEIAAEACGINTTFYKLFAFSLSAAAAGAAGALYASYQTVLTPASFTYNQSIEMTIMVVLGGMGSITGSIASAAVLTLLPAFLSDLAKYRMLIYSILLIVIMIFKPAGLLGSREFSMRRLIAKLRRREAN